MRVIPICIAMYVLTGANAVGQGRDTVPAGTVDLPVKVYARIGSNAGEMDKAITKRTIDYLGRMAGTEARLENALYAKDSVAAKRVFAGSQQNYQQLLKTLNTPSAIQTASSPKEYLPRLDSVETALHFLGQGSVGGLGAAPAKLAAIQDAQAQIQQLQSKWQQARDVEAFFRQREQQLQAQLAGYNLGNKMLWLNKNAFYFQQQLTEYKSILQDRDKLQEKVLTGLRNSTAFQHFMQKNSYAGRLFSLPDNYGSTAALPGLQTKDMIQQRIGLSTGPLAGSGADPGQYLQQKVDDGQQQINQLKDKVRSLGGFSGSGDMVMPQFTPNDQKVRTFLKRLVYSISLQTQQSYGIMPATADLGMMVGYKLSSKATIGVGGSYNIGLGQGISHLSLSGQGASIRSYIDVKARGSLWLTGGFEYDYVQGFSSWRDLSNWDQWQKSALFGFSKKFRIAPNKSSNIQLLFDALSKQHTPASVPFIFRVGYSFN